MHLLHIRQARMHGQRHVAMSVSFACARADYRLHWPHASLRLQPGICCPSFVCLILAPSTKEYFTCATAHLSSAVSKADSALAVLCLLDRGMTFCNLQGF